MESLEDLQLEHLMVSVVPAVPASVVPTMAAVVVDVPMSPGALALVLATTVAVTDPEARRLWRPLGESARNNTWSSG